MSELTITKEKVREAAAKCSTADATLRVLFPEAFKKVDDLFEFGMEFQIMTGFNNSPIMIGNDLAPSGMAGRCLLVNPEWEVRTQRYGSYTALTFYKKP